MPIPISLGKFNKRVTNRLMIRRANRPPFAAIRHRGRTSGREYRIPLNAFPRGSEVVFALTYGSGADWVKNVLADGRATLEYGGEELELVGPRIVDRVHAIDAFPGYIRSATKLIGVTEYLLMERA
jgi:deazaflavin-dependent oxidoreductase (nitroreductase family)